MRSLFVLLCMLLMITPALAAFTPTIEVEPINTLVFQETISTATYEFTITSLQEEDIVEIYTLVGVKMAPLGTFVIPNGTSKHTIHSTPGPEYKDRAGNFNFEYQIKGQKHGIYKGQLSFEVVSLKEGFEIGTARIKPGDSTLAIKVNNLIDLDVQEANLKLESELFSGEKSFSVGANSNTSVLVSLGLKANKQQLAGKYDIDAIITVGETEIPLKTSVLLSEESAVIKSEESSGFIIRKNSVTQTNEGNVPERARIEIQKGAIAKLFTTYDIAPETSERKGFTTTYGWEFDLRPGQTASISSSTNYTLPFILILLIVIILFIVRTYSRTTMGIRKSLRPVRTKGGEFAIRVNIRVKARKDVKDAVLHDRLPHMTKLYKHFGRQPDHLNQERREISWDIGTLQKGEERSYSYIIYSKLRAIGTFSLPPARLSFENEEGKKEHAHSNKATMTTDRVENGEE